MKSKNNSGFSLVELLISIAILSIIMVMISGFVSSTLISQRKAKKNMQMQTEAQRIYSQLSEVIMQATYIRVEADDGTSYVPDNYANYQLSNSTVPEEPREVIVDLSTGELYNKEKKKYPQAGSEVDGDAGTVLSFWALSKNTLKKVDDPGQEYKYITPKYIYIEYNTSSGKKSYVIFGYDDTELKMYRSGEFALGSVPSFTDAINSLGSVGEDGLLSTYVNDFKVSVDPSAGAVSLNMLLEDSKYKGYNYKMDETVNIRSSNVLTVKPQLLRIKGD